MKIILVVLGITILFNSCRRADILSMSSHNTEQVIALQPLGDYDMRDIQTVIKSIESFYHKKVIILQPLAMPLGWFNKQHLMYSADSIINYLSGFHNRTMTEIVGLTHEQLYTIKETHGTHYYDENLMGLGYQPGNACVISDYRIGKKDTAFFYHKLSNVIFHEIGHNMGLSHCPDPNCIMSVNNDGNDYCRVCRKKLTE